VAWALAVVAGVLALPVVATAIFMRFPVRWDGVGKLGVMGLLFPLHLLVVTAGAVASAAITWWIGATAAAWIFAGIAVLSVVMAGWPTVATWRQARRAAVPLSLAVYMRFARRPNWGGPPAPETAVYVDPSLPVDVWRPATPHDRTPRPAVVRVHGGGWVGGGRGETPAWTAWLNDLGFVVFDIDYRLAPPERWCDAVGDVEAALAWVVAHHADFDVDPDRVSVMGHSAGGHLGLLAACRGPVSVRSVVNVYGPVDLAALHRGSGSRRYIDRCLRAFLGGGPDDVPDRYAAVSPVRSVSATTPPTITVLGQSDRIVPTDQARALDAALTGAGAPHETVLLPGNDHAFDINWGGFGAQLARARIERFLARYA
jgi:acetyl esterase/lipase